MEVLKQAYWINWGKETRKELDSDFVSWSFDKTTVVICCKNKSKELALVLPALANQVETADLIILADDHSDDDSVAVFQTFVAKHKIENKVVRPRETGVFQLNTLRNLGFEHALDGIVIVMDADLIVGPGFIQAHARLHRSASGPASSVGPLFEAADASGGGPINFMWGHEGWAHVNHAATGRVPTWATVLGGNLGLHRNAWKITGGFDESYNGFYGVDDQDFHYRLFLAGVQHVGDFEAHAIHLPHDNAVSKSRRGDVNLKRFEAKYGLEVYQTRNVPGPIDWLGWRKGPWNKIAERLVSGEAGAVEKRGLSFVSIAPPNPVQLPSKEHVDYVRSIFDDGYVRSRAQIDAPDLFHLFLHDPALFNVGPNPYVDMVHVRKHLGLQTTSVHPYLLFVACGQNLIWGPSALFNPCAYAWIYQQLFRAPLASEAFLQFWTEGRRQNIPQHPLLLGLSGTPPHFDNATTHALSSYRFFDPRHYQKRSGVSEISPHCLVQHYLEASDDVRVSPNRRFDMPWFRERHSAAIDEGFDPLTWYLVKGIGRGATPRPTCQELPQFASSQERERSGYDLINLGRARSVVSLSGPVNSPVAQAAA